MKDSPIGIDTRDESIVQLREGGKIMAKKWMMVAFVFVFTIFGFSLRSIADCKSECRNEYESEVESCKEQYEDPSDAGELKMCLEHAKSEYQSCIDECEN